MRELGARTFIGEWWKSPCIIFEVDGMGTIRGTRKIGMTIFRPRKVRMSRLHFVEILHGDGAKQRVGPFDTRDLAEAWIRTTSAQWLFRPTKRPELLFEETPT